MTDRAGFFAGLADSLTDMCFYYLVAGILILGRQGWGVHLFWLLLAAAVCCFVFAALLKKPRGVPLLTAVTGGLFLAVMGLFGIVSSTPMKPGYGVVLAVGAGMAVGLPLYYALRRPLIHQHLARLDVLILALTALLLIREGLGIDAGTVALMTAVLFLDAAAAVGLRMSDGETEDGKNAFRASMVALAAAAALALLIGLLTAVFSRSGSVTGGVLQAIGAFFSAIGRAIERFFRYLASFITYRDRFDTLELEEMPSLANLEPEVTGGEMAADAGPVGVIAAILLAAAAIAAALLLRRKKLSRGTNGTVSASRHMVRRSGGTASALWQRLTERLRFAWTAFVHRDTPGGLLVWLERRGRRAHTPREPGETMRHFLRRMDADGGLDPLADALDREYYGGEKNILNARQCRELRHDYRRRQRPAS